MNMSDAITNAENRYFKQHKISEAFENALKAMGHFESDKEHMVVIAKQLAKSRTKEANKWREMERMKRESKS